MRKSSKAISLLLSGLMATSCFSMAAASVSAAEIDSEATSVDTASQRIAAGHQLVFFQFPTSAWGANSSVKYNAKKKTCNVFCNYYAIYGNENPVKTSSWEAGSTSMYKDAKGDSLYYYDITESGKGELEEGAEYGILFSTKANAGQADLLQPNTDGYQTCDLYFNTTCLGDTYSVDEPASTSTVRENTANSQKIDYLAHSSNGVGAPLKKVSTLCAYIDGINPGNTPGSVEIANALQSYLPNPVNEPSFTWAKLSPIIPLFNTTPQAVYDMYVEKFGALHDSGVPYEPIGDGSDLKSDGTLKDVYRYAAVTTEELDEATGQIQPKTVKYPDLDLVRERLNLSSEPTVTDIEAVSVTLNNAVVAPGEDVPTALIGEDGAPYTVETSWETEDTTFDYGTTYTLTATFTATEGYQFTDDTTVTLDGVGDGSLAYVQDSSLEDGVLTATFAFTTPDKTAVESVDLETEAIFSPGEAVPGTKAFSYQNGDEVGIGNVAITPADATFAYGTDYVLTFDVEPMAGYELTNETAVGVIINPESTATCEASGSLGSDGIYHAVFTFTMPEEPTTEEPTTEEPVPEINFLVAGSEAEIFGTGWDGVNHDNDMTANPDGTFTRSYTVDKAYSAVQLKAVKDESDWYGDETGNNVTFNLTGAGTFTVTVTPDEELEYVVTVSGDNVEFITEFVYDTVYAVGNGEGYWLNGASWDPGYVGNEMNEVADDVWEIEFENVPDGFERQIKFAIDGAWTHNFGGAYDEEIEGPQPAVYNGDNITFDTYEDSQTVKVQLDLSNFDFVTKEGATFTLTIIEGGEPGEAVGIIGDVNGDDQVTIEDATLIQRRGVELVQFDETQEKLGDVNGDGRISILDVTCVQKYLAEYTEGTGNAGSMLMADGTIVPANS